MERNPTNHVHATAGADGSAESTRRARRTVHIVTGVYVVIGFIMAIPAALAGEPQAAFIGFLIISGALAAAALISSVLRLGARIGEVSHRLRSLQSQVAHLSAQPTDQATETNPAMTSPGIDLAKLGTGDADLLTAATLDRSVYPRLVTTMEEQPPPDADRPTLIAHGAEPSPHDELETISSMDGVATISLMRQWKMGLRQNDLQTCRAVLATLVDIADADTVAQLQQQYTELADRTEHSLREEFALHLAGNDHAAMLETGRRMSELLPDRPLSQEFKLIEPHLLKRLGQTVSLPEGLTVSG